MNRSFKLVLLVGVALASTMAFAQCGCCGGNKKPDTTVKAKVVKGIQKVNVTIDGGYSPSIINAKKGKPIKLVFYRKEKGGCGDKIVFKSLKITKEIASGKKVVIQFTPKKAGTYAFTCGMGMYKGKVVVK